MKRIWDVLSGSRRKKKEGHRSLEATLAYWSRPDQVNAPGQYADRNERQRLRSEFLVRLISERVQKDARLFEMGCNVGRNLNYLWEAGFRDLSAIEINDEAVALMRERYPEVSTSAHIRIGAAENVLPDIPDASFDLVFTMAVLEHIHEESEWLFAELVRISTAWLITIEDEKGESWRHFPRNYRIIFEQLGLIQVAETQLTSETHGLGTTFVARVFKKT